MEFLALKDRMLLCKALHISLVIIESESSIVVTAVCSAQGDNWWFSYVLRECLALYTPNCELIHGFRQKNVVADKLANFTYSHRERQEFFEFKIFQERFDQATWLTGWDFGITDLNSCSSNFSFW